MAQPRETSCNEPVPMKTRKSIWGFIMLTIMLGSASAQGGDQCTAVFPFPVQSHMTPGLLGMNNERKITSLSVGTNYPFLGKSIQPNANCNNGGYWNGGTWVSNCSISGTLASPLKNVDFINDPDNFPTNSESFPAYGSQNDLLCDGAIFPVAGDYRNASWGGNNCVATLTSGQTYRFDTLSLVEGAVLNLNGATVYAKKLTIKNDYNSGFTGPGNLHVNELTVTGNGKLDDTRVTVYSSLEVSGNGNTGGALFQPRYIENVIMDVAPRDQRVLMAAGNWSIRNLGMKSNSNMTFLGQSTLSVYGLRMEGQGRITAAGSRSDPTLQLHQTLEMIGNATINGYLQARYLNTFKRQSTSNINLYFSGGSHWIDKLELGHNDKLFFDSGSATQFYIKNGLVLSDQMEVNAKGKANNLMLYNFGNVAMSGNTKLNAILYVKGGNLTMDSQAELTGAVSAVNVTMTGNSKVIHEPFGGDWPDICPFFNCKDIFTDPPTGGATMTPPPGVLQPPPPLGDLVCNIDGTVTRCAGHGSNSFTPGDHDFNNGSIGNQAEIIATGVTARLYFNNLDLNNARLNIRNRPENLFIYVKGDLSITGQNEINAILYVAGNIQMAGNAKLTGALAAGGNIDISGNRNYFFDQNAVEKVDLGGTSCGGESGGIKVDHFELSHSGQPLTCNPETVTVKACANAACTTLITDPVTATLSLTPTSASNGWIGGNSVSFSGGSTTVQLRNNTTTPVTIGVSSSTPTTKPGSSTLCKVGNGTPSVAACTLYFADSGLIFDVLDTYSNQPQDVTISAVKKDDITKQCVPGFTGVRSVGFWGTYNNPNTNNFGSKISIDGNAIATYAASVASPTPTTLNLTFDNQGKATLKKVAYPDAGQMQLSASHNGSSETAGLVMTGSDTFMARPVGLCITPPQGVCAAGDSSCPVFKKAGETFQVDIKAMAWESANDGDICAGNLTTPNFVLSNIVLGSTLVAPNPGTNATLGITTYNHVAATNSVNTISQTVSEVGVFRMTATPPVNGYFNYTIPSAQSQPVGRFVPWDFNLLSGALTPACGQFSYMSQPFGVKMTVQARNKSAGVTRNYGGEFAKGRLYLVAGNNHDGVDRTDRVGTMMSNWISGEAKIDSQSRFARLSEREPALTAPEEPFKSLRFGLLVLDEESPSVSFMADADLNPGIKNGCTKGANCNARQLTIPTRVDNTMTAYYGRLLAGTEPGVASAPLAIPLKMQYYEAGNWQPNKEDQCTRLSLAADGIRFLNPGHSFDAATRDLNLGAGRKIKLGLGSSAPGGDAAQATDGEILFHFAKPDISVRIPYKVDLAKQPSSPLWLSDPASANDGNLQGEAIFGSSRGNDRIIYRREVLQ